MQPFGPFSHLILASIFGLVFVTMTSTADDIADIESMSDCEKANGFCVGIDTTNDEAKIRPTCTQESCNFVHMEYNEESREFTVRMRSPIQQRSHPNHYFAIGFSTDNTMGDDFVIYCRIQNGRPELGFAVNIGKANKILRDPSNPQPGSPKANLLDQYLYCEMTLPAGPCQLEGGGGAEMSVDLASKKYMFMAAAGGVLDGDTGTVGKHHFSRKVKEKLLDFKKKDETGDDDSSSSDSVVLGIHSTAMILAFTFCIPNGIFISRFYKETWARLRICGKRRWFIFHLVLTLTGEVSALVGTLTVAFWYTKFDLSKIFSTDEPAYLHNVFGLLALILLQYLCLTNWCKVKVSSTNSMRQVLACVHAVLGFICYSTGNLNLIMSTAWTRNTPPCALKQAMVVVSVILFFCFSVGMSAYISWTDSHLDIKCNRSFFAYPLAVASAEEAPRPKLRKTILFVYIGVSGLVTLVCIGVHLAMDWSCQF